MRERDRKLIDKLENRIIELEQPVLYKNGSEVRFEIDGNKQHGIVIDSKIIYKCSGGYRLMSLYVPFDYRKYQVLCKGQKHWFKYSELSAIIIKNN